MQVFAYGSLMSHPVLEVLLHRVPKTRPAVLRGYRRFKLIDECYPAVVPRRPADAVCGMLLCDLSASDVDLLNHFEDQAYDRRLVPVWPMDTNRPVAIRALAYVRLSDEAAELIADWSLPEFESSCDYQPYLERCRAFMNRYEDEK